ncbi:uncharacterized protein LOC131299685 [Rhododendron vialii]|uniref:uncharacterized protein LOC131299685 n=1 Tax=Rhododendron vialii TaxID=182163 RepID=UPI00265DE1F1|nr:uncharacterized protein LOC131299685 [Rhododendron vialii]
MAEPSGGGGNGNAGEEENQPRGGIETPGSPIDDQTAPEASWITDAEVPSGGSGDGGHAAEGGDGDGRRKPGAVGRTPAVAEPGGPRVRRLNSRSGVEGLVITGLGPAGADDSGSGSGGDDGRSETPPRNPARGKDPMVEEGISGELPVEEVEFRPTVGPSVHVPITRGDFAEFVTEEELGRLLRENLGVVAAVIAAREDRQRQVERVQEEERLRAETERARAEEEAFARETELAEEA